MDMKKMTMLVAAVAVVCGFAAQPADSGKSTAPFSEARTVLPGSPCMAAPAKANLLHESGTLTLFSGETAEDAAFNEAKRGGMEFPWPQFAILAAA